MRSFFLFFVLLILDPRIIEPLASRCSKFRFKPLDSSSTSSRLLHIANEEKIPIEDDVVDALISTSQGDLRRSITFLQSASRLAHATQDEDGQPNRITARDIQEIAGVVPDAVVEDFARTCGVDIVSSMDMDVDDGSKPRRSGFDSIRAKVKEIVMQGYSASQLLSQVRHQRFVLDSL